MEITKAIDEVKQIRTTIYEDKRWGDGEYLSRAVVKLALLNSFIGEHIAEAEYDANTAESHYKATRELRKLELMGEGSSGTKADSQAYTDSQELLDKYNELQYNAKMLSIQRVDTNNLIDTIRSRLSFMKKDQAQL